MGDGSSNTAIVAIVILVMAGIGLAYYFGMFGGREGQGQTSSPTTIIERPTIIEKK